MLTTELEQLGYEVTISDYRTTQRNAPVDQRSYYDDVTISWEKE